MKKLLLLVMTTIVSLSIIGCNNNNQNLDIEDNDISSTQTNQIEIENELNPWGNMDTSSLLEQTFDNIIPILPLDFYEKIENEETFVLYLGKNNCKWCTIVYPLLSQAETYNIPIYYINTSYYGNAYTSEEDPNYSIELNDFVLNKHMEFQKTALYTGVPSIRYIEKGKVVYGISNPLSGAYYEEDADDDIRAQAKQQALNKISQFFIDIKNGSKKLPQEKKDIWTNYLISLEEKFEEQEKEVNNKEPFEETSSSILSGAEMTLEDLWELEKQYGIRLAPTGETSYWDTVEELPPNEK